MSLAHVHPTLQPWTRLAPAPAGNCFSLSFLPPFYRLFTAFLPPFYRLFAIHRGSAAQFSPIWGRTGLATVQDKTPSALFLDLVPYGVLPSTALKATGPALPAGQRANVSLPHLAFALDKSKPHSVVVSSIAGEAPAATIAVLQKAEAVERATYTSYGTPALAELKEAVQASVMWLTVYTPCEFPTLPAPSGANKKSVPRGAPMQRLAPRRNPEG